MKASLRQLFETETLVVRREHPALQRALQGLVHRREIESVLPGVYALRDHRELVEVRVQALRRYDPDAVVMGRAAARLSYWPEVEVDVVQAAVKHKRAKQYGFAFVRRTVPLDLVEERAGVRMTVPALTALDLGADLGGDGVDEALRRGAATLDDLEAALAAIPNQPGNRQRRQLLDESSTEPWSAAERRLHGLLRTAGIDGWQANVPVVAEGSRYVVDVLFRRERLVIEVDGRHYHAEHRFESDRWRQNALVLAGFRILRFTWTMLDRQPERVVGIVVAALGEASRSPSR